MYGLLVCIGRLNQFPDVSFNIDGKELILKPKDYISYYTDNKDKNCENEDCEIIEGEQYLFQTSFEVSKIDEMIILGDIFL